MTSSTCVIRPACADEASLLSELAFRSKAYWGYSDEFMAACRVELSYTPAQIAAPEYHFFVTEAARAIRGFYALEQRSSSTVEVEAMFVEPAWVGKGYGRALMGHAKSQAARLGATTMIIQSDPNAERFYRAAGGQVTGRRESGSIPGRQLPTLAIDLTTQG